MQSFPLLPFLEILSMSPFLNRLHLFYIRLTHNSKYRNNSKLLLMEGTNLFPGVGWGGLSEASLRQLLSLYLHTLCTRKLSTYVRKHLIFYSE